MSIRCCHLRKVFPKLFEHQPNNCIFAIYSLRNTSIIHTMDFGKILSKVVDVAKDYLDNQQKSAQPARQAQPAPRPAEPERAPEREKTAAEWVDYFREILKSEFPSYDIRENVAVTDLVGFVSDEFQLYTTRPYQVYKAEWGQPFTFVLEQNGKAVGVVMLGSGHSHDANVKYLISRVYAEKLNLPYINFYTQMPNERNYVIGRIRKFLN